MRNSSFLVLFLVVYASSYSQNYSDRLTAKEIADITIANIALDKIAIDSILRSKNYKSVKSKSGKLSYENTYADIVTWGYNKEAKMLLVMLSTIDYGYYSQIRKAIANKYDLIKTGPFLEYEMAGFYKTGLFTYVTAVSSGNHYGIVTVTPLESYPEDQ